MTQETKKKQAEEMVEIWEDTQKYGRGYLQGITEAFARFGILLTPKPKDKKQAKDKSA